MILKVECFPAYGSFSWWRYVGAFEFVQWLCLWFCWSNIVSLIDGGERVRAEVQADEHAWEGQLRYSLAHSGKVYKVKLNDGKEGKEAKYFVAKKMFLEGLSEDEVRSAFGEVRLPPCRSKSWRRSIKRSAHHRSHSWSPTASFSASRMSWSSSWSTANVSLCWFSWRSFNFFEESEEEQSAPQWENYRILVHPTLVWN